MTSDRPPSTYIIRNAPSDRVSTIPPASRASTRPGQRWRSSNPPAGDSPESKWWPDAELGRDFSRWTDVPPASKTSEAPSNVGDAVRTYLEERLAVSDINAVQSLPPRQTEVPPGFDERARRLIVAMSTYGPGERAPEFGQLLELGPSVLNVASELFPGGLWFSRWQPHVRPPRGRDVSAICRLMVAFGEAAVPVILEHLHSENEEHRYYATLVAAELPSPMLVSSVATLLFDFDQSVGKVALHALSILKTERGIDAVQDSLRDLLEGEDSTSRDRLVAMRALAVLRDVSIVPVLANMLREESIVGEAAWRVLRMLCVQDFKDDRLAWLAWHKRNGDRSRLEWLIDGLNHEDRSIRELAIKDLRQISKVDFGYDVDASIEERRQAQEDYERWRSERTTTRPAAPEG